jgi:hypothetical protein
LLSWTIGVSYTVIGHRFWRASDGEFTFSFEIEAPAGSALAKTILETAREVAPSYEVSDRIILPRATRETLDTRALVAENELTFGDPAGAEDEEVRASKGGLTARAELLDILRDCKKLESECAGLVGNVEVLHDDSVFRRAIDILGDEGSNFAEAFLVVGIESPTEWSGLSTPHHSFIRAIENRIARKQRTLILAGRTTDGRSALLEDLLRLRGVSEELQVEVVYGLTSPFVCGRRTLLLAPQGVIAPPARSKRANRSRLIGLGIVDFHACRAFRTALSKQWPLVALDAIEPERLRLQLDEQPPVELPSVERIVARWEDHREGDFEDRQLWFSELRSQLQRKRQLDEELVKSLLDPTEGHGGRAIEGAIELREEIFRVVALDGNLKMRCQALVELAKAAWHRKEWHRCAVLISALEEMGALQPVPSDVAIAAAEVSTLRPMRSVPPASFDDLERWRTVVGLCTIAVILVADMAAAFQLETLVRLLASSHDKTFCNKLIKNLPFVCIHIRTPSFQYVAKDRNFLVTYERICHDTAP